MITWQERVIKATQAWDDWASIPIELRMDRAMKEAGFRDVIKENQQLREALRELVEYGAKRDFNIYAAQMAQMARTALELA